MPEKINEYLDSVCAHIKYKAIHQEIRDELNAHINDLKDEYVQVTENEEVALDLAIAAMGDCESIGKNLNKQHQPQTEWAIIGLTAVIALIGGAVIYISSLSIQAVNFERYLFCAILGIVIMAGCYFFDYTKLKKLAWPLYLLTLALLVAIIYSTVSGYVVSLDNRVISVLSQIIILPLVISFAGFVETNRSKRGFAIIKLQIAASLVAAPMFTLRSISPVITFIFVLMMLILYAVFNNHFGGSRRYQLFYLAGASCLTAFAILNAFVFGTFRMARIINFFMQDEPLGLGYQRMVAGLILSNSNLFGRTTAMMNGRELIGFMPEAEITTSYAIVNVIGTLGWVAGTALLSAILVFIYRMFITTMKIKNKFGFYLSLASCSVLFQQFVTGIMLNFNLIPLMSVSIPFVSYGGTGYIVNMALIGLILSIWRMNNITSGHAHTVCVQLAPFTQNESVRLEAPLD